MDRKLQKIKSYRPDSGEVLAIVILVSFTVEHVWIGKISVLQQVGVFKIERGICVFGRFNDLEFFFNS